MAKTKRKLYDIDNARDMQDFALVKAAGLDTKQKYSRPVLNALEATPIEQLQRGGISFTTHRAMLKGSEERTVEFVTQKRHDVPKCLWTLPDPFIEALSDYQAIWTQALPSETVSLAPRMGGGDPLAGGYNHESMKRWSNVRRCMTRRQAKDVEWALRLSDGALISEPLWNSIHHGAWRLRSYFDEHTVV